MRDQGASPLDPRKGQEIVNVDGGAIAHGHPIGATGAILALKTS